MNPTRVLRNTLPGSALIALLAASHPLHARTGDRISNGLGNFTLILREDGRLHSTGSGHSYQLANGSTSSRSIFQAVSIPDGWSHVAAMNQCGIAIRTDSTLWGWGIGEDYVFGNNSAATLASMTQLGSERWLYATGPRSNSRRVLAIRSDSTLWGWGNNASGQLGDGTRTTRPTPVQIGADKWLDVSNAHTHTLAIRSDSTLWAWGNGFDGQLGLGEDNSAKLSPVQVGSGKWIQVSAGINYSLGIRADSTFWAWGEGRYGSTGLGHTGKQTTPLQVGSAKWRKIVSPLENAVVALQADSSLWSWGASADLLGRGPIVTPSTSPGRIGSSKWRYAGGGYGAFAALREDGTYWVWGDAGFALGAGNLSSTNVPVRIYVPGKQDQTINPFSIPGKKLGDADFSPGATATSGLPITYSSSDTTRAKLVGGMVRIVGVGSVTITASQAGDSAYNAAENRTAHFSINKGDQTLTFHPLPSKRLGDADFAPGAASSAGLPVTYSISDTTVATLVAGLIRIRDVGTTTLTASQSGNSSYNAASTVQQTLTVTYPDPPEPASPPPAVETRISGGMDFGFILTENGNLYSSGFNRNFRLGQSDEVHRQVYLAAKNPGGWRHVSATPVGGMALKSDSSLWAWGNGEAYVFGNNSQAVLREATRIGTEKWISITTGWNYASGFGIGVDGSLWAWGRNSRSQLGDGTTLTRPTPVRIGAWKWRFVASGEYHTLAIRSDSTLWAWGDGAYGVLGIGTLMPSTSTTTPRMVGDGRWIMAATGQAHSLGLMADSTLWAWGRGSVVGLGSADQVYSPRRIGDWKWRKIVPHLRTSAVALRADSTLWTWGEDDGLLGQGTWAGPKTSPVQVGSSKWRDVGCGRTACTGLDVSGRYWAWGNNGAGELGDGTFTRRDTLVPIEVPGRLTQTIQFGSLPTLRVGDADFSPGATATSGLAVAYASSDTTVVKVVGSLLRPVSGGAATITASQAGDATYGAAPPVTLSLTVAKRSQTLAFPALPDKAVGDPDFDPGASATSGLTVQYASSDTTVAKPVAGKIRLLKEGTVEITATQAGDGAFEAAAGVGRTLFVDAAPVSLPAGGVPDFPTRLSSNAYHAFIVREDGNLYATGNADMGRLPLAHSQSVEYFQAAALPESWKHVAATERGGMAIRNDGSLWAWGEGRGYSFGNDDISTLDSMTRLGADSWKYIAAGKRNPVTLAIRSDSTLWGWGANANGELGDGTAQERRVPVPIGSAKWSQVSVGHNHALAIQADGSLWSWGQNSDGQLGDGTLDSRDVPTRTGSQRWLQVAAGERFSLGIRGDSTLWAWGDGWCGGTGLGSKEIHRRPRRVGSEKWIKLVTPLYQVSMALRADSTLWSWGSISGSPELGHGAGPHGSVVIPTQIGDSKWRDVGGGDGTFMGLDPSGRYWAWGKGNLGNGGEGGGTSQVPVPIGVPGKSFQTLDFPALPARTFGDSAFTLSATATSGLPVGFASSNPAVATVSGTLVTVVGAGSTVITATQAGDSAYSRVSMTRTLMVGKAAQGPTIFSLGSDSLKNEGDPPFRLHGISGSGLPLAYSSSDSTIARITGDSVHVLKAGSVILTASQGGDANRLPAADVERTLRIRPATLPPIEVSRIPVIPPGAAGTTVEIALPRMENAVGYRVQAGTDTTQPPLVDTVVADPVVRLTNLTPGQDYFWRVAPVHGSGEAPFTPWLTFKVKEKEDGSVTRGSIIDSARNGEVRLSGIVGLIPEDTSLTGIQITLVESKAPPSNLPAGFQPLSGRIDLDARAGAAEVKDNQLTLTLNPPDTSLDGRSLKSEDVPLVYFIDEATGRLEVLYDLPRDATGRIILPLSKGRSFLLAVDTLPPTIKDSTPAVLHQPGAKPRLVGLVEDNIKNSLCWLKYRKGGDHAFDSAAVSVDSAGRFDLPLAFPLDSAGFEYHLVALDGRNRVATARTDMQVEIPPMAAADSLPHLQWRLFSPPTLAKDILWSEVAAHLGTYRRDWKLFERGPGGLKEFGPALEKAAPGTAYWIKTRSKRFLPAIPGGVAAVVSKPFEVVLPPGGWRSFGNPYLFPVSWQSVLDSSTGAADALVGPYTYRDMSWVSPLEIGALLPWEGYYAHNKSQDTIRMRIPSLKALDTSAPAAKSAFRLEWIARGSDGKEAGHLFGALPRPTALAKGNVSAPAAAAWRAPKPESPEAAFRAGFATDGEDAPLLQTDFRALGSSGGAVWTARLSDLQPGRRYVQRILGAERLPAGLAVALADPATGAFIPWSEGATYVVEAQEGESRRDLLLLAGTPEYVASRGEAFAAAYPSALELRAFPNPVRGETRIRFVVPASTAGGLAVRIAVHDLNGREVRRLLEGPMPTGRHSLRWDARDARGIPLAAGTYRLILAVGDRKLHRALQILP